MSAIILNEEHTKRYDKWIETRRNYLKLRAETDKAREEETKARNDFARMLLPDDLRRGETLSILINSEWLLFSKDSEDSYFITYRS